jgi:hypothetical protein
VALARPPFARAMPSKNRPTAGGFFVSDFFQFAVDLSRKIIMLQRSI